MYVFILKLQSAVTNTLSNRMRNLRFKRKTKSLSEDEMKSKKRKSNPLAYTATLKIETALKSKASSLMCTFSYLLNFLVWHAL